MKLSFIIIDDRELDCYIAEKVILKTGLSFKTEVFHNGIVALNFIKTELSADHLTVVLLDIMMPVMNGFQFLEEFETLSQEIKQNYRIIPVTTSLNKNEINKISNFESVTGVLKKPYTSEALIKVIEKIKESLRQ